MLDRLIGPIMNHSGNHWYVTVTETVLPTGFSKLSVLDRLQGEGDEAVGIRVLQQVLEMPCRWIADNAGLDGTVVVANIRKSKDKNYGFDANKMEYTNMRQAGIVDPVKVTRSALQNASSIAGLMLTTEVMVTKIEEDEPGSKVHGSVR